MEKGLLYVILGAVGIKLLDLIINVIGNLITPDRKRLADGIRDWWARQSDKRAKKRIEELEKRLETLSKYATNQSLLSLYFGELAFKILKDFSVVALCFIGIIVRPFSEFFLLVVAAISMIMLSRVFLACDKAMRLSIQVRSYDLLKVSIEQQMAELQEKISGAFDVSGTWKGNFCAGQQGVLKVTQDGNNLQAILTTDCLHLGIDEVYQEELSGTIKGRQVILAGESVSSAQEEISYELDDFELTLSIDGKKLTGTVLDKDGVNGAEFLRKD